MKLIVISHPGNWPDEAAVLNRLFGEGLLRFHLRKPEWSESQIEQLLNGIDRRHYPKIVLHDHFGLAENYGLGGIHFTGRTKHLMQTGFDFQGTKSCSTHSLAEIDRLPEDVDYAFLSPIFPSISKNGYAANWDVAELTAFLQTKRKFEVIALGGIRADEISCCRQMGFDGIAVLGSLWAKNATATDVISNFRKLKAELTVSHLNNLK